MSEFDIKETYWSHKGRYAKLSGRLEEMVPARGPVNNADENPKLEAFRVASNCYYDLYNNGLCNRLGEFREVMGFDPLPGVRHDHYGFPDPDEDQSTKVAESYYAKTEEVMDRIILEAAVEQGLLS